MKKINAWIEASRLRTLPLALASVGLGSFLAAFHRSFDTEIFIFCLITTLLLQILSNLANDYGDTQHGADSLDREGPVRQVQLGIISKKEMLAAIFLCSGLALLSGMWLLKLAFAKIDVSFIVFFMLGLVAIASAVKYTMGKSPYGYRGFGDLSVLFFFGIVGVTGSYYLHTKHIPIALLLPAIGFGLLSTAVLNLNNIRDIQSDKAAGKYSIPVRIGRKNAVVYHWLLLAGAFGTMTAFTLLNFESYFQFVFLATLPLFIKNALAVKKYTKASDLDPYLKQLAISSLLFVITFGLGLILTLNESDMETASLAMTKLDINLGRTQISWL